MTVKELRKRAAELGIVGYSKMRKAELETAIAAAQATPAPAPTPEPIRFTDADVETVGNGSLADAAEYLRQLPSKGAARKFRKMLRKAGYPAHAGVNIERYTKRIAA